MATEFETGMPPETERELERIRREVWMAKQELHDNFEKYVCVLRDKLAKMERQLDEVVYLAETQARNKQIKMNQLIIAKAEVLHTIQHNELNETLVKLSRELEEEIQGLEANVHQVPSVWLEWSDKWLDEINKLCNMCEGVSYVNRHTPVWTGVNQGEGQNEISSPCSLVTDRDNGEVFVCDLAGRIQVYDKDGSYQRSIKVEGMLHKIAITSHHLFVWQVGVSTSERIILRLSDPYRILKLDKLSGDIICYVMQEEHLESLIADTDTLFGGMDNNRILHLNLDDLKPIKVTVLNSPYLVLHSRIPDIKVTTDLFVVLFEFSNKPIQTFSKEGNFIRVIA